MKVLILAEGQTEERFVKDVLSPHLVPRGIYAIPKIVRTKVVNSGPDHKGGNAFGHIARDLRLLLMDSSANCITTLIDLFHLDSEFPGFAEASECPKVDDRLALLSTRLSEHFGDRRLLPYFLTHEFEALTLIDAKAFTDNVPGPHDMALLRSLCSTENPESINGNDPPAYRLRKAVPGYRKVLHGSTITREHGLQAIRKRCVRFDAWLSYLEGLAQ